MKVIGYVRVSSEEQRESGLSLANQREKIKAMAGLHDWDLVDVVEDTMSAKDMRRPGLGTVLEAVRSRKVQGVVVYKLDRLTRVQRDLMDLLDLFDRFGVRLVSVCEQLDTQSASGRFFVGMLGLVAQWERETIGERTKAAIDQLRSQGKRFSGRAPFGWMYTTSGDMVEEPGEQKAIDLVLTRREDGKSLRWIAEELHALGIEPRTGNRWHPMSVKRLAEARI